MRLIHLRVKIRSLAAEQKIIRNEEQRVRRRRSYREKNPEAVAAFWSLRKHRVGDLGWEVRCSLLAYACLRGRSYESCEPRTCGTESEAVWRHRWERVAKIAARFGGQPDEVAAWIKLADAYRSAQAGTRARAA